MQTKSNNKGFIITSILSIFVFGLYVFNTNNIATTGHKLKNLQKERQFILLEQEKLNLQISINNSFDGLQNYGEILKMNKIKDFERVKIRKNIVYK